MQSIIFGGTVATLVLSIVLTPSPSMGQFGKGGGGAQPSFIPAGYDDYQNMLDQLGIKAVRKGRNSKDPDTSNDATANVYKDSMPDVLTFKDGTKVTSAAQWPKRRAEIVEDFEREVYGRVPANVPKVTWEVTSAKDSNVGGVDVVTKTLVGHVDNSAFPQIKVDIQATFTVAKGAKNVPILIEFGGGFGGGGAGGGPTAQAVKAGWGYGTINPTSVQADSGSTGGGLRAGIIGLTNKGEPRKPDDWGSLRAWAWGVGELIKYFEANPDSGVDATKVCITGVSRYGKAALVTGAFETKVAAAFVASSGAGGAALNRYIFGEMVENVAAKNEYHWMAGNYIKYAASEFKDGRKAMTAADLPVDSHEAIALIAPRLCLISYGIPSAGDPNWVNAPGSFKATVLAGPVYKLLGKKDLGTPGDYLTDKMPPVNT